MANLDVSVGFELFLYTIGNTPNPHSASDMALLIELQTMHFYLDKRGAISAWCELVKEAGGVFQDDRFIYTDFYGHENF
jgi:hypothetical protein